MSDFIMFRLGGRLALVRSSQVIYLTSESDDGLPLGENHRQDNVLDEPLKAHGDLLPGDVRLKRQRRRLQRSIQFLANLRWTCLRSTG